MPPKQNRAINDDDHRHNIPVEIIEEILLNLPSKSLIRFSSVSKPWNSMISEAGFMKRYRARERDFLFLCGESPDKDSTCPLSSLSWDNPSAVEATAFASPFEKKHPGLLAKCDELLLLYDFQSSLFLWNPNSISMERSKKKLPQPLFMSWPRLVRDFSFGLGYDSVGDDFKIVKIPPGYSECPAELYSLRSDSWRQIQNIPSGIDRGRSGVFVSGKLHWRAYYNYKKTIWFDLSTEKFGEVAGPDYRPPPSIIRFGMEISALRGMLCKIFSYEEVEDIVVYPRCVTWVMEAGSCAWSKMFSIKGAVSSYYEWMVPLYVYGNGEILVRVKNNNIFGEVGYRICVYKDESSGPKEVIRRSGGGRICDCFLYARLQPSRSSRLLTF